MTDQQFIALFVAIMIVAAIAMAWSLFMLFRNGWVYERRMKLLDDDYESYGRLASYDEMMRKFWVWDVKRFIR